MPGVGAGGKEPSRSTTRNESDWSHLKDARLARKQLVDYSIVRAVIEMAALASKSA